MNAADILNTGEQEAIFTDEFGIERRGGEKLPPDFAEALLPKVLKNDHLRTFLGLSEEEIEQVTGAVQFFKQLNFGLTPVQAPKPEALSLYKTALGKLKDCPVVPPYFVVQDKKDQNRFYFCLDVGIEKVTIKENAKYFLLTDLEVDPSTAEEIQLRMAQLQKSPYFPKIKACNDRGKNVIGVEFVPHTGKVEKGEDVSDFLTACREVNFGPDTNATNFTRYRGQLKYIDQDVIGWLKKPANHPYDEKKHY